MNQINYQFSKYANEQTIISNSIESSYDPSADIITVRVNSPPIDFYHEIIHSTGHKNRLNRVNLSLAEEELLSEFGSIILYSLLFNQLPKIENEELYLKKFNEIIAKDSSIVFRAFFQAIETINYILTY